MLWAAPVVAEDFLEYLLGNYMYVIVQNILPPLNNSSGRSTHNKFCRQPQLTRILERLQPHIRLVTETMGTVQVPTDFILNLIRQSYSKPRANANDEFLKELSPTY